MLEPETTWETAEGNAGVEDPRVTWVEALGLHVMTYVAFGPLGPRTAIATSTDLRSWTRHGPVIALDEALPWVLQWHNAIDPDTDVRPGDYFQQWLGEQLNHHHWTRQTLADWQPPAATRRGRRPRAAS